MYLQEDVIELAEAGLGGGAGGGIGAGDLHDLRWRRPQHPLHQIFPPKQETNSLQIEKAQREKGRVSL